MRRGVRIAAVLAVVLAGHGASARAQYRYPAGYGGYGWGGWGGAQTVQGSIASGMGALAAGEGYYNQQTAVARSINADTAMRWNNYMWQSQQVANKMTIDKYQREESKLNKARGEIAARLRDNPTASDIARGAALNVALDELNNPKVYLRALQGASAKVEGAKIRDIPFQYAAAAITVSVDDLIREGPPAVLKGEAFAADRKALREVAAELRKQGEEEGKFDPGTLARAQDQIRAAQAKVKATLPTGSPGRLEADKYLRSLLGLTRMLQTPAINVLLAGVEKRPDTTLGDLLSFMKAFNLRFGVAKTPRQVAIYNELFPMLDRLRDELAPTPPPADATALATPDRHQSPAEFFEKMDDKHLDVRNVPPPPTPGPPAQPK